MNAPLTSGEVTYDSADFLLFARLIRGRAFRNYRIASVVLAGLMVLTLALYWALGQRLPIWQMELGLIAAVALWWLSTGRLQARIVEKHARKIGAHATQAFAVKSEGFEARGPSDATLTKWSDVRELDVVQDRLFVFLTDRKAFIVPRRIFASQDNFERFVAEAKACWRVHHRL